MAKGKNKLREPLEKLVLKLEELQRNGSLRTVFTIAHVHGYPYTGPNYQAELAAAREVLDEERV